MANTLNKKLHGPAGNHSRLDKLSKGLAARLHERKFDGGIKPKLIQDDGQRKRLHAIVEHRMWEMIEDKADAEGTTAAFIVRDALCFYFGISFKKQKPKPRGKKRKSKKAPKKPFTRRKLR